MFCRHRNDSSIKMGSDESHPNVSLIVRSKATRQRPQLFQDKGEPKWAVEALSSAYQPNALPLGHTLSLTDMATSSLGLNVHRGRIRFGSDRGKWG